MQLKWIETRKGVVVWPMLLLYLFLSLSLHFLHNHGFAAPPPDVPQVLAYHDHDSELSSDELCPVVRLLLLQSDQPDEVAEVEYLVSWVDVTSDVAPCCELPHYTPARSPPHS